VIPSDAKDNELKGISGGGINRVKEILRGIDLVQPRVMRRELHLPCQFGDFVNPIPSHWLGTYQTCDKNVKHQIPCLLHSTAWPINN
jgi:hypothetical protein